MLFEWAGVPWLGSVMAFMLAIGVLGGVVTWIAGPNTGVLAIAKAGYLPKIFPKNQSSWNGAPSNVCTRYNCLSSFCYLL